MILCLKTDTSLTEVVVCNSDGSIVHEKRWETGRQLSVELLDVLREFDVFHKIQGLIIYEGPGSYTGLRIGISVANALSYSDDLPMVAVTGESWLQDGLVKLQQGLSQPFVVPHYGGTVHITQPKK